VVRGGHEGERANVQKPRRFIRVRRGEGELGRDGNEKGPSGGSRGALHSFDCSERRGGSEGRRTSAVGTAAVALPGAEGTEVGQLFEREEGPEGGAPDEEVEDAGLRVASDVGRGEAASCFYCAGAGLHHASRIPRWPAALQAIFFIFYNFYVVHCTT
jgi:hypothetical protein